MPTDHVIIVSFIYCVIYLLANQSVFGGLLISHLVAIFPLIVEFSCWKADSSIHCEGACNSVIPRQCLFCVNNFPFTESMMNVVRELSQKFGLSCEYIAFVISLHSLVAALHVFSTATKPALLSLKPSSSASCS